MNFDHFIRFVDLLSYKSDDKSGFRLTKGRLSLFRPHEGERAPTLEEAFKILQERRSARYILNQKKPTSRIHVRVRLYSCPVDILFRSFILYMLSFPWLAKDERSLLHTTAGGLCVEISDASIEQFSKSPGAYKIKIDRALRILGASNEFFVLIVAEFMPAMVFLRSEF